LIFAHVVHFVAPLAVWRSAANVEAHWSDSGFLVGRNFSIWETAHLMNRSESSMMATRASRLTKKYSPTSP
jgi:hypothetical protein